MLQGQPAAVKVFNVPSFETPISQKTFFKGDKVQLKWNKRGSSLLVLAQTEVDRSGKSYYGETTLYLLSTNGAFDARVTLDKDGPIADVSWSPNSREFGVVYGYTPAKATIFSDRAVAKHSFPLAPRNTIQFSPNARFVLIGGFGNFVGQIDIFDLEKDYRKVCTIESGSPSVCAWSPDSRYLMTATTSPRLRVDNGVKIWHVSGPIMYHENMDELYNIEWRPAASENVAGGDSLSPVPTPHASAATYLGTVKTPSKPAGAYRPPGARGLATPLHFKREDEGGAAHVVSNNPQGAGPNGFGRPRRGVPGAELADSSPAARTVPGAEAVGDEGGKKNKKKRSKKANQDGRAEVDPNGGASLAPYDNHAGASDRRSPERPGPANGYGRDHRGRTRNNGNNGHNGVSRSGSHIQHGQRFNAGSQNNYQANQGGAPGAQVPPEGADSAQNLKSKKVRSLQKKIRAIEDLEMRRAGGEKLEDTQIKKINTKADVLKELVVLEREF